jgi:lipid-binding SYLF domain-containing protein
MATTTTTVYTESQPATFGVDDSRHAWLAHSSSNNSQGTRLESRLTQDQSSFELARDAQDVLSRARAVILITALTGITFVGSMSGGLLTIGLPGIAADLKLPENLLLW